MAKVIGIDHESHLYQFAKKETNRHRPNVRYVCGNIWHAHFMDQMSQMEGIKEQSVDLIMSTHYLHLTDSNINLAFNNIARLLKKGIVFCLFVTLFAVCINIIYVTVRIFLHFIICPTDGFLFLTISLWSDLFEIEKSVALQKFSEILTESQRKYNTLFISSLYTELFHPIINEYHSHQLIQPYNSLNSTQSHRSINQEPVN